MKNGLPSCLGLSASGSGPAFMYMCQLKLWLMEGLLLVLPVTLLFALLLKLAAAMVNQTEKASWPIEGCGHLSCGNYSCRNLRTTNAFWAPLINVVVATTYGCRKLSQS